MAREPKKRIVVDYGNPGRSSFNAYFGTLAAKLIAAGLVVNTVVAFYRAADYGSKIEKGYLADDGFSWGREPLIAFSET